MEIVWSCCSTGRPRFSVRHRLPGSSLTWRSPGGSRGRRCAAASRRGCWPPAGHSERSGAALRCRRCRRTPPSGGRCSPPAAQRGRSNLVRISAGFPRYLHRHGFLKLIIMAKWSWSCWLWFSDFNCDSDWIILERFRMYSGSGPPCPWCWCRPLWTAAASPGPRACIPSPRWWPSILRHPGTGKWERHEADGNTVPFWGASSRVRGRSPTLWLVSKGDEGGGGIVCKSQNHSGRKDKNSKIFEWG